MYTSTGDGLMTAMNIKDARRNFSRLVDSAQRGSPVTITRRGRTVAVITPPAASAPRQLPDLSQFRAALKVKGAGKKSTTITRLRSDQRY